MASVMHRAAYIDDENAPKEKELLSRLVVENKVKNINVLIKLMFYNVLKLKLKFLIYHR